MFCPVCLRISYCPCPSCKERNKNKELFIEDKNKNTQKCPYCGFTENINWWFMYNVERALYFNGSNSLSEFNKEQSLLNINETRKSIDILLLKEENRIDE